MTQVRKREGAVYQRKGRFGKLISTPFLKLCHTLFINQLIPVLKQECLKLLKRICILVQCQRLEDIRAPERITEGFCSFLRSVKINALHQNIDRRRAVPRYHVLHFRQLAVFRKKGEEAGIYLHTAEHCGGKDCHQQEEKKDSVTEPASALHLKSASPEMFYC